MSDHGHVYLVDDDPSIRDAIGTFLELSGFEVRRFESGEIFLEQVLPSWRGCVLLDLKMPGARDGLQVHAEMVRRSIAIPVIFLTAYGDVGTVRTALKAGAADFLSKPVDNDLLLEVVRHTLREDAQQHRLQAEQMRYEELVARLTGREREVMLQLVQGRQHREIADALGISPRTVEVYKARMMEKLGVRRLADVIHLASRAAGKR